MIRRVLPAKHVDFIRNADILIADSQYTDDEYPNKVGWGHARATTTTDWAIQADVKTLVLFHHDPTHTDADVDAILDTCRQRAQNAGAKLNIIAAHEGLEMTL